jgi:hypothetical protein
MAIVPIVVSSTAVIPLGVFAVITAIIASVVVMMLVVLTSSGC